MKKSVKSVLGVYQEGKYQFVENSAFSLVAKNIGQLTEFKFRYSIGNCKDPRFESTWAPSISKELQQHLNSEEFRKLKKEWQFQVKAEKCYDKEYERRRYTGLDRMYCKLRVASGHPEERAKLAIVENNEPKMGNDDIILCKKGSLISKSWIVKNVGCTNWPQNPRLVV